MKRLPRAPFPLYPTLLSIAFVAELFVLSGVSPFPVLRTLVLAVAIPFALTAVGRVVMGDRDRGALFAAIALLLLMTGGDLRIALILGLALAALLAERYVLPERARTIRWPRITVLVTRLSVVLLLAVGIHAVQSGTPGVVVRAVEYEAMHGRATTVSASADDPDIYMILLDGYARADVLHDVFGVDGASLVSDLESRGFSVASTSRSNYTLTSQVLSSMLDMAHMRDNPRLAGLLDGSEGRPKSVVLRDVINDNVVLDTLRSRGYAIESISSGFEEVAMREADRFIDSGELNEFEIGMLRRTLFGDLLRLVAPDAASAQQRSRIANILLETGDGTRRPLDRPVFVLSHLPTPHPPWVFHADGSPRTVDDLEAFYADTSATTGLTAEQLKTGYVDQVRDLDRRLLPMLDALDASIESRGRPAVVVLWSDHGSWIDADGGDIRLRFKNLLAVRGVGVDVHVDPDLTLVNLFPSLFEQLFGIATPRLADTTYQYLNGDEFALSPIDDPDAVATP